MEKEKSGNNAKPMLADSAFPMICPCGKPSEIPLCRECFDKGLLRSESRFEKPSGVSNNFFMLTMLVMAILGLIAAWLSL